MKKKIQKIMDYYYLDISLARANGFEAIMFPLCTNYETYTLSNSDDMDDIYIIATESGWDKFVILDLSSHEKRIVSLHELEVV